MKKFAYEPFNMAEKERNIDTIMSAIIDTLAIIGGFISLFFVWVIAAAMMGGI